MRFMLVGTGFAETHIQWIKQVEGASVDVLCYLQNKTRAQELATRYGIPQISNRPLQIIKGGNLDALAVVTPPDTHEALISAALSRGLVAVTDKPLASTSHGARALADKARITGARACVTFQWRQHPAFQQARSLCQGGKLGRIFYVDLRFHHDFLAGPTTLWPWRHSAEEAGAGTLGDQGVHLFDLLRFVFPAQWQVTAAASTVAWAVRAGPTSEVKCDTEDVTDVQVVDTDSGCCARVFATRVDVGHREVSMAIQGTAGSLHITLNPNTAAGRSLMSRVGEPGVTVEYGPQSLNAYRPIIQHFLSGADGLPENQADFNDGLEAQVFLEEAVRLTSIG
ncbi:Gfo/Idh/MocA family protein [Paraburkholderia xenovorans]|uniref:Gfo/Idh/MocA family protein n=1 Tax=Paraburkholderia xenovorans TaxID=36873 RepID=UPI0038B9F202